MTDLAFMTATDLAPMIEKKEVSPVELTEQLLRRIEQYNDTLRAYITLTHETALEEAKAAEQSIMNGQYKGPLHGIPLGIKDNYETKGIKTTAGTKVLENYVPEKTATSVEKLKAAGAVTLGKLNMHQLGLGSSGVNPTYGTARNPWNKDYIPGGSSSASATALAAGLATVTTGTDTWGSNRVPAAMSGVYGLKSTYGLISSYGLVPTAWSLDHGGPFTRSVSDAALMLNHMAGHDPKDPASLKVTPPDYTKDLDKGVKGLKVGVPSYYLKGLDPDIERLFFEAIESWKNLGAEVKEIDIPELSMAAFAGFVTASGDGSSYNYDKMLTQSEDYEQDARILLMSGSVNSSEQYLTAQLARRRLTQVLEETLEDVDVLIGPTVPIETPKLQEDWVQQNLEVAQRCLPFTVPANLTGMPSFSVPMGLDSNGLPAGMQIIGGHLSEQQLLQAGYAWEKTNPLKTAYKDLDLDA